ncbi:phosphoribosyltransferase-like protein [Pseudomonas viridiflava]|uniref:phosphoribosyltransferase-like protein n=1 Tax=Pseudomonas viridiflava TaxID=33069 RepID=UPI000F024689|nr:hypothetical protein [Pseudomonas viridiflava]
MRPLLILAETRHVPKIQELLQVYGHPAVIDKFVSIIDVDLTLEVDRGALHLEVLSALQAKRPDGASEGYAVCATADFTRAFGLKVFLDTQGITLEKYSGSALAKAIRSDSPKKPDLFNILSACELTVITAASRILGGWSHSLVDMNSISAWKGQFGRLGKFAWVADIILANTVLIAPHELGRRFVESPLTKADAVVYNKDSRGTVKSGEVIANLLTKRLPNMEILDSLTEAIEKHPGGNIVMVEDGLWTGTEAVGVIESLLGRRDRTAKTEALRDAALLSGVSLTLVYGVTTDYGVSMVSRYLQEQGLTNITIHGAESLGLTSEELLNNIAEPGFCVEQLRKHGPDPAEITPFFYNHFASHADKGLAIEFCKAVGRQLFDHYLADRKTTLEAEQPGVWKPWDDMKREKCCFGMNGLGLTHAFSHSVPKATLPLLWYRGTVEWAGYTVEWVPLFENA